MVYGGEEEEEEVVVVIEYYVRWSFMAVVVDGFFNDACPCWTRAPVDGCWGLDCGGPGFPDSAQTIQSRDTLVPVWCRRKVSSGPGYVFSCLILDLIRSSRLVARQ